MSSVSFESIMPIASMYAVDLHLVDLFGEVV